MRGRIAKGASRDLPSTYLLAFPDINIVVNLAFMRLAFFYLVMV